MKFELLTPKNLQEALELLSREDTACLAGGTNLLVSAHKDAKIPKTLLDITNISELCGVTAEGGFIKVGSLTTFSCLEKNEYVINNFPCLAKASSEIGGPQIRNTATIGGNICNASPAADSATALMALEAELELQSTEGTRRMPVSDFFVHVGMTAKKQNEIMTYIYIPLKKSGKSLFTKVGKRNALAISMLNMAVAAKMGDNTVTDITIAVGSVAPTVIRARKTEAYLLGRQLDEQVVSCAQEILLTEIKPIDDLRATAEYRRKLGANVLKDMLLKIKGEVK